MADRYWVGGTGNWTPTNTANWSASSGGASGASVPTATDNVFFDSASAAGNYSVLISGNSTCANISVAKAAAGTLTTSGGVLLVSGNWTSVGTGVNWTSTVRFNATSGSYTVTTGGLSFGAAVTFFGVGGTWQLQDSLTTPSTVALWGGTLDLNGQTVSCNFMTVDQTSTRVLAFGTGGTINITGSGALAWEGSTATGFSYTGTGSVNFTYAGGTGTRTINHGSTAGGSEATEAPPFNINAGTDTIVLAGHFSDVNFTGFAGTLNGSTRTIYGNLTISSGTTTQSSANVNTFAGTSGTKTITTNGRTLNFPLTFNGAGSTFVLADDLTGGSVNTQIMTLAAGTINLNGKTLSVFAISATGSGVRSLIANGGVINLFGNAATIWNSATVSNATFTGLTVNCTYSGSAGTRGISAGSVIESNSVNFNFTAGTDSAQITGSPRDLNFTGFSGTLSASTRSVFGNLTFSPTMTVTAGSGATTTLSGTSGTKTITTNGISPVFSFTLTAPSGTYQLADDLNMYSTGVGTGFIITAGTLDLNNRTLTTGTFSGSGGIARSINFGTSGTINLAFNGTTVWSCGLATNFTYTGTPNVNATYSGNVGTRTLAHGTAGGTFPTNLPPPINIVAGTDNVSTTSGGSFNTLNFTGFSGNLTNSVRNFYGNVIFSPTMNTSLGTGNQLFASNGVQILDTAGVFTDWPFVVGNNASNGTVFLANALTSGNARTLTINSGTLNANDQNITIGRISFNNSNVRTLNISNTTVNLNGNGIVFTAAIANNATLVSSNSTILLSDNTANARFFVTGGLTYNNLIIGGNTVTSNTTFTGNGVFNTLSTTKTVAHNVIFTAGSTTTVNAFAISGTEGNIVTITSDTANVHNLVYTGAGNVDVSYANISYSNASPSNTWYALLTNNNTDGGNNTGWIFTEVPGTVSSNFFLVF